MSIKVSGRAGLICIVVIPMSFLSILVKNPTLSLFFAAVQIAIIIYKARLSIVSVVTILINFCLLQQYFALQGERVYGLLNLNYVPIYFYELCVCVYMFNFTAIIVIRATKLLEKEKKMYLNSMDLGYYKSLMLFIASVVMTVLIFPSFPDLSEFGKGGRFTQGILPFTGWSCIPFFFLLIGISNKKAEKIGFLCIIFVALWYAFHGERVDVIGLMIVLCIRNYHKSKENLKMFLKLSAVIGSSIVLLIIVGMIRSGSTVISFEQVIRKILIQETACDVTHVFNCAVDTFKTGGGIGGYTYLSYIVNIIPLLKDNYSFEYYIGRNYSVAGGGLLFAEPVANFGLFFCFIFIIVYWIFLVLLLKKSTQYRYLVFIELCLSIFRTTWYGLNYPMTTILYIAPFVILLGKVNWNLNKSFLMRRKREYFESCDN